MALIKCSECSGKVSTTASACPHCGAPVPPPVVETSVPAQPLFPNPPPASTDDREPMLQRLSQIIDGDTLSLILSLTGHNVWGLFLCGAVGGLVVGLFASVHPLIVSCFGLTLILMWAHFITGVMFGFLTGLMLSREDFLEERAPWLCVFVTIPLAATIHYAPYILGFWWVQTRDADLFTSAGLLNISFTKAAEETASGSPNYLLLYSLILYLSVALGVVLIRRGTRNAWGRYKTAIASKSRRN